MKVDSAPVTLPDEGPEQRWRRTVRKRPAKLKLGRLLRDFGYAELDDDVADAIEARMAGVGLAIRPLLREAAADEIVTVYRVHGVTDDDARGAAEAAAAAAAAARPREPATPAAPERPRSKPRRAADPDSARAVSDLKGQLADARAESERLRAELDSHSTAMADADRLAREALAEQSAVVEDQAHRLAELSGLLNETRAALAEARDEIRRALGDLPVAVVEAPVEDGGLSEEEGWLTDADEPLPPSPVEAAVSAVAVPLDELAPDTDDAPATDLEPVPMDDVFAGPGDATPPDDDAFASAAAAAPGDEVREAGADAPPEDDDLVFEPEVPAAAELPAEPEPADDDDVFGAEAEAPADPALFGWEPAAPSEDDDAFAALAEAPADEDDVFSLQVDEPAEDDVFGLRAEALADDVFGPPAEALADDVFGPPAEALADDVFGPPAEALAQDDALTVEPAPKTVARPPAPARRSGFFTVGPPPPPDDVPVPADDPPPFADAAAQQPAAAGEWRLDGEDEAAAPPADDMDLALDWKVDEAPAEPDDLGVDPAGDAFDPSAPAPAPEPSAWAQDGSGALPPPPPLPPLPFADEPRAHPPEPAERSPRQPARRGRMARGRGRWQGTCSVCERFPEVTRRKDLEAAGWQLDGDFPTCPQCRGLA